VFQNKDIRCEEKERRVNMDRIPEPEGRSYPEGGRRSAVLKAAVITVIIVTAALVAFFIAFYLNPGLTVNGVPPPYGPWSTKTIVSPTEVTVDFGRLSPSTEPVDIRLILVLNTTTLGMYGFQHNEDGALILLSGSDVGTLVYSDLADNGWIDDGDKIMLSDLSPGSDYELQLIWAPSADRITSTYFATPTG
jgi:hypothetical protein